MTWPGACCTGSYALPLNRAALDRAEPHRFWLTGGDVELGWPTLLARVAAARANDARPHAFMLGRRLAALLMLTPFDTALLALIVACDRLPRIAALAKLASAHGHDLTTLLGAIAGDGPRGKKA